MLRHRSKGTLMLILTRKQGDSFTIGDDVTVTVVEISGTTVRIGITAPADVQILRDNAKDTRLDED